MINFIASVGTSYNKIINTQGEFDALTIEANDRIKLNDIFYGSKDIDQNNVRIESGGIKGSQEVTAWTSEGGGIYSKVMSEPKWLYIDGQEAKFAQKSDWIDIVSIPADNQVEIAAQAGDVTGAKFVNKVRVFTYSFEYEVIAYNAGVLTLDRDHTEGYPFATTEPTGGNQKIKLFGLLSYLSDDYDWGYEGGKLYVKLPSDATNFTINAVNQDSGFIINANSITINNVTVSNFYKAGIYSEAIISELTVINCTINNCRTDGISLQQRTGTTQINNNTIYDIGASGVFLTNSTNQTISGNTIYNIGVQANEGWVYTKFRQNHAAAMVYGSYNIITESSTEYSTGFDVSYNTVYNCHYSGIHSGMSRVGRVHHNIVHDVLQVLEDGGGIYNFFFRDSAPVLADQIEIDYNFVYNIPDGWSNAGVYQDNRTGANNVHHNVVWNVLGKYAAWCNNGSTGQVFEDNTLYGGITETFRHRWSSDGVIGPATDVNINRNIFIQSANLNCMNIFGDVYSGTGGGNNNYFVNPYYDNKVSNDLNLAGLQALYSQDANSNELTNYITAPGDPDNEILLITNPSASVLNGSAPAGSWKDVDGNVVTNYSVAVWRSLVLLKDLV